MRWNPESSFITIFFLSFHLSVCFENYRYLQELVGEIRVATVIYKKHNPTVLLKAALEIFTDVFMS